MSDQPLVVYHKLVPQFDLVAMDLGLTMTKEEWPEDVATEEQRAEWALLVFSRAPREEL